MNYQGIPLYFHYQRAKFGVEVGQYVSWGDDVNTEKRNQNCCA